MKQISIPLLHFYMALRHTALCAFFAACIFNAGCATYPSKDVPAVDNSRTFSVPYDTAWKKMLESVTQEGENLTALDKNSGLISLQRNVATGDISLYAHDDTGMFWSQAVANVTIQLTQHDERSTTITINMKTVATGRDFFDVLLGRSRQMTLHSRGYLERHYLAKFSKIIAALKTSE